MRLINSNQPTVLKQMFENSNIQTNWLYIRCQAKPDWEKKNTTHGYKYMLQIHVFANDPDKGQNAGIAHELSSIMEW